MHIALAILEKLEINTSKGSSFSAEHTLFFKKRAIAQCNTMLDCRNCNSTSGFMTLLIVICERMVSSLKRLSATIHEQSQQHDPSIISRDKVTANGIGDKSSQSISFGEYEVDLIEEQRCLLSMLIMLQLINLERLLRRLKSITILRNWEAHRRKLASTDEKFREAAANIRRMNRI